MIIPASDLLVISLSCISCVTGLSVVVISVASTLYKWYAMERHVLD